MKTKYKYIIAALICLICFSIIRYNDDYMVSKPTKCIVLDKLTTTGGHKSSGSFYLVLKTEKTIFDLIVSPATFSQSEIGQSITFNLRQFDIRQNLTDNIIFFFSEIILLSVSVALLITSFIIHIFKL